MDSDFILKAMKKLKIFIAENFPQLRNKNKELFNPHSKYSCLLLDNKEKRLTLMLQKLMAVNIPSSNGTINITLWRKRPNILSSNERDMAVKFYVHSKAFRNYFMFDLFFFMDKIFYI